MQHAIEPLDARPFGRTTLQVSAVGFGAWAIGGPASAGSQPIGWGPVDDPESEAALRRALERGISFFDTADFYGLGHSEQLVGRVIGNRADAVVASKVGQKLGEDGQATVDYSKAYILAACEQSLRRLRRDAIDFYQLHSARLEHLERGECQDAMETLVRAGKVRYWGLSLNTFRPAPEAEYLMQKRQGHGFQLVLNVLNQRAVPVLARAAELGYGVVARMPFQFGLLTGKFTAGTRFPPDDHRSLRLAPRFLADALPALAPLWKMAEDRKVPAGALSLGFAASFPGVSTVIPGIRTPRQAEANAAALVPVSSEERASLWRLYETALEPLVARMERPAS